MDSRCSMLGVGAPLAARRGGTGVVAVPGRFRVLGREVWPSPWVPVPAPEGAAGRSVLGHCQSAENKPGYKAQSECGGGVVS